MYFERHSPMLHKIPQPLGYNLESLLECFLTSADMAPGTRFDYEGWIKQRDDSKAVGLE